MQWPQKPTCHSANALFKLGSAEWRDPSGMVGPYKEDYRRCSYCGSMHPEDLVRVVEAGAQLGGADWKYGWPHKFYVEGIPNPIAGQMARCGTQYQDGVETPIMQPAPATMMSKWYNDHILDEGYDDEAREKLLSILEQSGVKFVVEGGTLSYRAPHRGYQR